MRRQPLEDGTWFDKDTADRFDEDTNFDGSNRISVATGSQWDHEELYRTAKGRWVLLWWSQRQGSSPVWRTIDDDTANRWLVRNGHGHVAPNPKTLEV